MFKNNLLALVITFLVALIFLRTLDFAAHRGWIESRLSRKLIHIGTGPIYVLCWLLFDSSPSARWLAMLVPLSFTLQFAAIGFGLIKDEASVKAMSRTGDRREILRGPLYYGIIFVLLTLLYWLDSPIGIVALMLMCGGDGLADILGRRFGRVPLPWNSGKSWLGSLGMLLGGWLTSFLILVVFVSAGVFPAPLTAYLLPVSIIALVGALVESLPFHDIDNLTVTAAAMLAGHLLF